MPTRSTSDDARPAWARTLVRVLAYGLLTLVAVALLLALALFLALRHLQSADAPKAFRDVGLLNGGTVAFRSLDLTAWRTYPTLRITVDSLRLSGDPDAPGPAEFLRVHRGHLVVTVDPLGDTLVVVDSLLVRGGGVHFVAPARPPGDARRSVRRSDGADTAPLWWRERVVLAPDLRPRVSDFDLRLERPDRGHDVDVYLRDLATDSLLAGAGFGVSLAVDAHLRGLQFGTRHGAYGRDAPLRGRFRVDFDEGHTHVDSRGLRVGGLGIAFGADLYHDGSDTSRLRFAVDSTVLALARPLLAPGIDSIVRPFDVDGVFGSVTTLRLPPKPGGGRPHVTVDLALDGNRARVDGLVFPDTYLRGRWRSGLEPGVTFAADQPPGSRFEIDTARTTAFGFATRSGGAVIRAPVGESARISAPATRARGTAADFARLIGATNFSFPAGTADVRADLRGPLLRPMDLVAATDGTLRLAGLRVGMPGSGLQLPLKHVTLAKTGASATVDLRGTLGPAAARDYRVTGEIDGVRALLVSDSGDRLSADVELHADHLAWRDVLGLFDVGEAVTATLDAPGGLEAPGGPEAGAAPARADTGQVAAVRDLKAALRQVRATFAPTVAVAVDTVSYYGFRGYGFATGLHFTPDDSLVLERSRLRLAPRGELRFRGALELEPRRRTGYAVTLDARRLDLGAIAAEFDYFGQAFLRDVGRLPDDVDLALRQRGVLDAVAGLLPNRSAGRLTVVSAGARPFRARVDYEPDRPAEPSFASTRVRMAGSPELLNGFFATERFTFVGGAFDFAMDYGGLVPDLRGFLREHRMRLGVEGAGVRLEQVGATVPLTALEVSLVRDTADVYALLRNDSIDQELTVTGRAREVSELVFGNTGGHFSSEVSVTSPRLVWRELAALIDGFTPAPPDSAAAAADPDRLLEGFAPPPPPIASGAATTPMPVELDYLAGVAARADSLERARLDSLARAPGLRENVREIFAAFDPTAELCIGEIALADGLAVYDVMGRVHMGRDSVVYLDTTALTYLGHPLGLSGRVDLGDLARGDFAAHATTDGLDVASLLAELDYLGVAELREAGRVAGALDLDVDVAGTLVGADTARLLPGSGRGTAALGLHGLVLAEAPTLNRLGRKLLQRERLDTVLFGPIETALRFEGGSVRVPLTEVQTNGFEFFVDGILGLGARDTTALWVSVPVATLFRDADGDIPERRGWREHRMKLHLLLEDGPHLESEGLTTKLKLRKR